MSNEKLKEVIKYITALSIEDKYIGRVKLYKLIFFCDIEFYKTYGRSITGEKYHKQQQAPVLGCIKSTVEELKNENTFMEIKTLDGRIKPVIQGVVSIDALSKEELFVINNVVSHCNGMTATQVSHVAHEMIPDWDDMIMEQDLPLEVALGNGETPPQEVFDYIEANARTILNDVDKLIELDNKESEEKVHALVSSFPEE